MAERMDAPWGCREVLGWRKSSTFRPAGSRGVAFDAAVLVKPGLPVRRRTDACYGHPGLRSLHAGFSSPSGLRLPAQAGSIARAAPSMRYLKTASQEATLRTSNRRLPRKNGTKPCFS